MDKYNKLHVFKFLIQPAALLIHIQLSHFQSSADLYALWSTLTHHQRLYQRSYGVSGFSGIERPCQSAILKPFLRSLWWPLWPPSCADLWNHAAHLDRNTMRPSLPPLLTCPLPLPVPFTHLLHSTLSVKRQLWWGWPLVCISLGWSGFPPLCPDCCT